MLLSMEGIAHAPLDYALDGRAYRQWRHKMAKLVAKAK